MTQFPPHEPAPPPGLPEGGRPGTPKPATGKKTNENTHTQREPGDHGKPENRETTAPCTTGSRRTFLTKSVYTPKGYSIVSLLALELLCLQHTLELGTLLLAAAVGAELRTQQRQHCRTRLCVQDQMVHATFPRSNRT